MIVVYFLLIFALFSGDYVSSRPKHRKHRKASKRAPQNLPGAPGALPNGNVPGQGECADDALCATLDSLDAMLDKQTETISQSGTALSGRLEMADLKLDELGKVGKRLEDVVKASGKKVQEQGAQIKDEGAKLEGEIKAQADAINGKIKAVDGKLTGMEKKNQDLVAKLQGQTDKVGKLQGVGVKVLDKLGAEDTKIGGKLAGQAMKFKNPLPEEKFNLIQGAQAKLAEKMGQHDGKLGEAVNANAMLNDKMLDAAGKINDAVALHGGIAGKTAGIEGEVAAQVAKEGEMEGRIQGMDAKMGDISAKTNEAKAGLSASNGKIAALDKAFVSKAANAAAKLQKVGEMKEHAGALGAQVKAQAGQLAAVQAEMAKPKPVPGQPPGLLSMIPVIGKKRTV